MSQAIDVSEDEQLAWAMEQSRLEAAEQEQLAQAIAASTTATSSPSSTASSPSGPPPPLPPPPLPTPRTSRSTSGAATSVSRLAGSVHAAVWGTERPDAAAPMNALRTRQLAATTVRQVEVASGGGQPIHSGWRVDVAAIAGRQRASVSLGPYETELAAQAAARHEAPPIWDVGQHCVRCGVGFGMLRRRHHCRNCGFSVCKSCTKYWPKSALPASFTESDAYSSIRVCLGCDASAMAMRAALLGGDVEAVTRAYADGSANINLRCCVPPAGENQPALLLPVHLAAAADSLPTLKWLAETQHCPIVGPASLSLGKPSKSVLRVAIEAQSVDCMQWLVTADDAPPHCGLPTAMPLDSGCAPRIVHRALEAALQDGYRQRQLLQLTIESAVAQQRASSGGPGSAAAPPLPPAVQRVTSREARANRLYPSAASTDEEPAAASSSSAGDGGGSGGKNEQDDECVVCLAAPRECVFLECRHACVCEQCGGTLAHCPLCRAPIERLVRMFQ